MTVINLRVKKRNIDDKAIDASKLEFLNQDEFKAQKADGSATSLFKLNSSDKFELLKLPIVGSNPTAANELSRKDYVDTGDSAVRGEFAAADALVLADAKDYTDVKVGLEESARMSEDALIRAEFAAADAQVRLDFASADAAVLSEAKAYTDSEIALEESARMAQDAAIRSEFAAEDLTFVKLDGSRPITGDLNLDGHSLTNVNAIVPRLDEFGNVSEPVVIREVSSEKLKATQSVQTTEIFGYFNEAEQRTILKLGSSVFADGYDIFGIDQLAGEGSSPIEIASTLDMLNNSITNLQSPTSASDAATKGYVDGQIETHVTDKLGQPSGIATLDSFGKVPVAQLPNAIMEYQGMWDASTNSPMLSNSGNAAEDLGNVYKVSAAGSVDFGTGSISFEVGDYVILGAMGWEKSDTTDAVSSVNGQSGIVVLDTDDVSEGTSNLYFTDMRAQTATIVDEYTGTQTDKALSVRATKALLDTYQINVDAALESRAAQEKFELLAQDVTNQYIDLSTKAIAATIVPSIDRLLLIEGYDYTVSIVGGKTRLSFIGSIATGGFEALAAGDRVVVRYLKDLR